MNWFFQPQKRGYENEGFSHSAKKGFLWKFVSILRIFSRKWKKVIRKCIDSFNWISLPLCEFFLPMISFMHNENCVRRVTQKWEFSGLVGRIERKRVWATTVLYTPVWHDTLHNEDHHVFISCDHSLESSLPVIKTV